MAQQDQDKAERARRRAPREFAASARRRRARPPTSRVRPSLAARAARIAASSQARSSPLKLRPDQRQHLGVIVVEPVELADPTACSRRSAACRWATRSESRSRASPCRRRGPACRRPAPDSRCGCRTRRFVIAGLVGDDHAGLQRLVAAGLRAADRRNALRPFVHGEEGRRRHGRCHGRNRSPLPTTAGGRSCRAASRACPWGKSPWRWRYGPAAPACCGRSSPPSVRRSARCG